MRKSNVSYSKDHREQAEREQGVLVTFDIDGKAIKTSRFTIQGVMSRADGEALSKMVQDFYLSRKKKSR